MDQPQQGGPQPNVPQEGGSLKWLVVILAIVILAAGGYYYYVNYYQKPATPVSTTNIPATTSSPKTSLSEQPDTAKFNEYFTDAFLSKLAIGEQIGPGNSTKTTVFDLIKDQFCTNFSLKKDIPSGLMAGAVYDVTNKTYIQAKAAFPMELKQGGTSGCDTESWPAGKYENKIYVSDILVAVLPFKIK